MTDFDILALKHSIGAQREKLLNHPIYKELDDLQSLRIFMEYHVFAVWDFMLLLKALQRDLTSVDEVWLPSTNRKARRLINEIVLAEESDLDINGEASSHFEMYLDAMKQIGADTSVINRLVDFSAKGHSLKSLIKFNVAEIGKAQQEFVRSTYDILRANKVHQTAAAFNFGREDLIPDLFSEIIRDLNQRFDGDLSAFVYYLDRHIELDADEHGPMADKMVGELCGHDFQKWAEAKGASAIALDARLKLWDAIYEAIILQKQNPSEATVPRSA